MKSKSLFAACCLLAGLLLSTPVTSFASGSSQTAKLQQTNGWSEDKTSFIKDGQKQTGIVQIDGTYYYFDNNGNLVLGMEQPITIGQNMFFIKKNGTVLRNQWALYNNYWYYAKDSAKLCVNEAALIGGKTYCFYYDGRKLVSGPKTIQGKVYLLNANGVAKTGFQRYNGKKYFFNPNGTMITQKAVRYKGNLYFTSVKGHVKTGWIRTKGKTYYATPNGKLKTGWADLNGKKYYFSLKGILKGGWMNKNGLYYYYSKKGVLKTGWFKVGSRTYYAPSSGSDAGARITGIHRLGSNRYMFSPNGVLCTGFKVYNGNKYYMDSKGIISTGWRKVSNKWYFFESSGVMKKGWLVHNGRFYYMDPASGAMVTGNKQIGGATYNFNSDGSYSNGSLYGSWTVKVNRAANVVTVYKGNTPVKAFLCSTGLNNATPLGTFSIMDKLSMHELNGPTWGYYCSHITSDILFHSIPAPTTVRTAVPSYKFNVLGQQASQGCIRLAMGDAKWLYDTVPIGSTVVVYDDAGNPGPLGKPARIMMSDNPTYSIDPTDPIIYPSYSTGKY